MPFMVFCMIVAFIVQLLILFQLQDHDGKLRYLSLPMLEFFPLSGALYYAIRQPPISYLGWKFGLAMCLWIAGAVLLGYMLAWGVYLITNRENK